MVTASRLFWLLQIFLVTGCAASGPTIKDYQVMTQALQAEARQAQRTITDLEVQREALQRELGDARTAKARLEGDVLNAERRLLEARHLVDLQREELAFALDERKRLAQDAREVQAQLTEVGRLRQQISDVQSERIRLQTIEETITRQANEMGELKAAVRESLRASALKSSEVSAPEFRPSAIVTPVAVDSVHHPRPSKMVRVRSGDSLWALARRYGVPLDDLKAVNRLKTDLIVPGQELLLPDPAP
jgi:LysM repeat protein